MKRVTHYLLLLLLIFVLAGAFSCSDEKEIVDPPPVVTNPKFTSISISGDNKVITIGFSEGVFKGGLVNQPLSGADFSVSLTGGQAVLDSFRLNHIANDTLAYIRLFTSGLATGEEQITVAPVTGTSVVNSAAIPMKASEKIYIMLADIGIIGEWISTGANLSVIFRNFGFDSVYMHYKADDTFIFKSHTIGGIENVVTGTYQQSVSSVPGFRIINLEQLTPVSASNQGIFSLENSAVVKMTYEVVQTSPQVNGLTPPTPELGFGSSGLLGSDNTQVFLRTDTEL
ncbi:MAG: hypothetical protein FD170_1812 [Bacteroidetes bacterium]|nr:MAG: hypothetical protein FD170_1812 [Bacteroidota bacterium]